MNVELAQRIGIVGGVALTGAAVTGSAIAIKSDSLDAPTVGLLAGGGGALAIGGATAFIANGVHNPKVGVELIKAGGATAATVGGVGAFMGLIGLFGSQG